MDPNYTDAKEYYDRGQQIEGKVHEGGEGRNVQIAHRMDAANQYEVAYQTACGSFMPEGQHLATDSIQRALLNRCWAVGYCLKGIEEGFGLASLFSGGGSKSEYLNDMRQCMKGIYRLATNKYPEQAVKAVNATLQQFRAELDSAINLLKKNGLSGEVDTYQQTLIR